ncbi:glycosyltransferase family 2 protein [Escherichia coli]|uniref:glycosyltransferase family 2 protein n=1 Tax=Escherichia coli TaxID=562 RepID=UPI0039882C61
MKISLVVPVFNEEATIPIFYKTVREFEELQQYGGEASFGNGGSKDGTESIINSIASWDPLVVALSFTRNFGKEPALFAGLDHATDDIAIPIDVDLQDPIEVIPHLITKWQAGADMVLAKRTDRSTDGRLKRKSAEWFYKLHNKISSPKIEENVGDFRLMSGGVVENIKLMPERGFFMKGVLSWVGGKTDVVEYARAERFAGDSKFNGWKLWNLPFVGVASFSTFPLRMWTYIGLFVAGISFFCAVPVVFSAFAFGNPVRRCPSLLVSILFLGGIQLIGIGALGEYIGRIYVETKSRPKYILKKRKSQK